MAFKTLMPVTGILDNGKTITLIPGKLYNILYNGIWYYDIVYDYIIRKEIVSKDKQYFNMDKIENIIQL